MQVVYQSVPRDLLHQDALRAVIANKAVADGNVSQLYEILVLRLLINCSYSIMSAHNLN